MVPPPSPAVVRTGSKQPGPTKALMAAGGVTPPSGVAQVGVPAPTANHARMSMQKTGTQPLYGGNGMDSPAQYDQYGSTTNGNGLYGKQAAMNVNGTGAPAAPAITNSRARGNMAGHDGQEDIEPPRPP